MAPRGELGVAGNATTTTLAPRVELRGAGSGTAKTRVMEIWVANEAATAQVIGLGRAAVIGVTPTTPITFLGEDTEDTWTEQTAIAWATAPTLPTNPLRRFALPASIGAGIVWTFGSYGLVIPASGSIIIWNIGTGSAALGFTFVIE